MFFLFAFSYAILPTSAPLRKRCVPNHPVVKSPHVGSLAIISAQRQQRYDAFVCHPAGGFGKTLGNKFAEVWQLHLSPQDSHRPCRPFPVGHPTFVFFPSGPVILIILFSHSLIAFVFFLSPGPVHLACDCHTPGVANHEFLWLCRCASLSTTISDPYLVTSLDPLFLSISRVAVTQYVELVHKKGTVQLSLSALIVM